MRKIIQFATSFPGIIVIATVIRLILSVFTHHGDMENYIVWAKEAYIAGFSGFYDKDFTAQLIGNFNYPPLILYVFTLLHALYELINVLVWQINIHVPAFPSSLVFYAAQKDLLYILYKLPSLMAEIGSGVLIYYFLLAGKKKNHLLALLCSAIFLFNPALIYNSAVWGQIEAIPIFFLLLSFYLLLKQQQPELASLSFVTGLLMKQSLFIFIPVFALLLLRRFGMARVLTALIVSLILFYISFTPFYHEGNMLLFAPTTFLQKVQFASNSDLVSKNAYNFWWLISGKEYLSDRTTFLYVPYQIWGYIITALFILTSLWSLLKKPDDRRIFYALVLTAFVSFLFLTRMHERHLHHAIALMPLAFVFTPKKIVLYILLSLLHLYNLYVIWGAFGSLPWAHPAVVFGKYATSVALVLGFLYLFYNFRFTKDKAHIQKK